ncbi:uncharacterized protein LOC112527168 isoform X1 [Cynara cardunculus var. scolymus]|uniref:uncharacterized protein LOC112527168 isoform X1 n=2 Tax=Cynara cardunculus var. scolymus TaxID=59895 RepID=UPI000D62B3CD|nr:uncharacterized protein LOC112527168 isoform X1 [Cynara cardunculus var. scolymus]
MDRFSITTATTTNASTLRFSIPFPHKQLRKFGVFAAKDDNKLGNWDQMERKFGKLIGENPKLTLAKIKDSKLNPEQDKGKRPKDLLAKAPNTTKHSIPNVVLWKAATLEEDDVGAKLSSRLSFKPNLSLKMGKEEGKERFSDLILVRNPEPLIKINDEESTINIEESTCQTEKDVFVLQELGNAEDQASGDHSRSRSELYDTDNSSRNLDLTFEMENVAVINLDPSQENEEFSNLQEDGGHENDLLTGSQPSEHRDIVSAEESSASNIAADSVSKLSPDATLQTPPKRLDQPAKEVSNIGERITRIENLIPNSYYTSENFPSIPHLKDREDTDWKRAEDLIKTTGREEVELISSSNRGFVASFGSLIGFLPYRNLATKWKFLAFESWLRMKGLDPATYRKNLGIIGSYDAKSKTTSPNPTVDREKIEEELSPNMKLEDLLAIYDQEKLQYLSTFVGQKIKVNVILADRESRKLIFSVKPKEKEESIERKRSLMTKLKVGDIVTCCIRKISYFGIFVEIERVPALIHQTEVSWDATLNPTSSFKIGQVVEAKVHQLDFALERISLSLKEITPDPLTEALEAVLDDHAVLDGTSEADQPENEWDDLELLVEELQQYEGIDLVTKGRFFLSPCLTPTFQVYMASMFKNQYKLLARAGNKVQEVVVQTSLGTEEMKHAILICSRRVE